MKILKLIFEIIIVLLIVFALQKWHMQPESVLMAPMDYLAITVGIILAWLCTTYIGHLLRKRYAKEIRQRVLDKRYGAKSKKQLEEMLYHKVRHEEYEKASEIRDYISQKFPKPETKVNS